MKTRPVRGTHDIFGENIIKLNSIREIVSKNANIHFYKEINTPIFELTDLFQKPLGEQSDVVLKEMYTFKDRNDENLTLRPEYTTPMIRAAITNNLLNELPLKVYGIGPMFRRERPQKGRYRQFNQINFEIFGSDDYFADVELICIANDVLKNILPDCKIELNINSLGTKKNLLNFKEALSEYFINNKKLLSEESKNKIYNNPLRILDSKNDQDIEIAKNSPSINEFISREAKEHYENVKNSLSSININYTENKNLVRGLDYYCNTVFEFKTNELGSQDTLLGGGRYDGLIDLLGGPDIPGIGWAAGIERISMLMKSNLIKNNEIHLAILDKKFKSQLLKLIQCLKDSQIPYFWNYKYNLKKSLSKANSVKAKKIIIIGEEEYKGNYYTIKNLENSHQDKIKIEEIGKYINDKS